MIVLLIGLAIFLGIHSTRIFAEDRRTAFIADRGEGAYKGIYSVASLIGFALIVWGYGLARAEGPPLLYDPPGWTRHIAYLLMLVSMVAFAASGGSGKAGYIKTALKHPMLVGIKVWALAHLLTNGDLASVILFLAFLAWAVVDRISVKKREAASPPEAPAMSVRHDIIAVVGGLVVYAVFLFWAHGALIGVPLVAL